MTGTILSLSEWKKARHAKRSLPFASHLSSVGELPMAALYWSDHAPPWPPWNDEEDVSSLFTSLVTRTDPEVDVVPLGENSPGWYRTSSIWTPGCWAQIWAWAYCLRSPKRSLNALCGSGGGGAFSRAGRSLFLPVSICNPRKLPPPLFSLNLENELKVLCSLEMCEDLLCSC
jgi:hypothetical protein